MKSRCASCSICQYAQNNPDSLFGRIWRWHTKWCPLWKAYQRELAEEEGKTSKPAIVQP